MNFTRRETMAVSGAALVATVLPLKLMASTTDLISGVTGGIDASGDGISLTAPEIAENGNTVPISIDAPGAVAITVLAAGNPTPGVAKFNFGELEADNKVGIVVGLAWTEYGGEILKIETVTMPGKGRMQITGKLGDVMQESVKAAMSDWSCR